jgi:hypothetical protein
MDEYVYNLYIVYVFIDILYKQKNNNRIVYFAVDILSYYKMPFTCPAYFVSSL